LFKKSPVLFKLNRETFLDFQTASVGSLWQATHLKTKQLCDLEVVLSQDSILGERIKFLDRTVSVPGSIFSYFRDELLSFYCNITFLRESNVKVDQYTLVSDLEDFVVGEWFFVRPKDRPDSEPKLMEVFVDLPGGNWKYLSTLSSSRDKLWCHKSNNQAMERYHIYKGVVKPKWTN
jgi:hypothetical protein